MKINRFLAATLMITSLSVLYVWQQTEIFRLAYEGQKKMAVFQDYFDKNTVLKYNIEKGASLVRIGNRLSQDAAFHMPKTYQLVRLNYPAEGLSANNQQQKESLAWRIFGIKRQAEAQTIGR